MSAQPAAADPLSGTWVLNAARTHYGEGAEPRLQETMECTTDNTLVKCVVTSIRADGRKLTARFAAAYDGRSYTSDGIPGIDHVSLTKVNDFVADATFTFKGKPVFAYRAIQSRNGRHLTVISVEPETRRVLTSVVAYDRRQHL